jgi:erythromycin esterase-like protein
LERVYYSRINSGGQNAELLAGPYSYQDWPPRSLLRCTSSERRSRLLASHKVVYPLSGQAHYYDPVLELIGSAPLCLLGEATHGTDEFYRERAEITKRLIKEKGFTAVAVEADWPDAFRVNRYVRGLGDDKDANEALGGFKRFPTWMWRNTVILDFVEWLREYNASLPLTAAKVGFYGLDLYSLYMSIEAGLLLGTTEPLSNNCKKKYGGLTIRTA